MVAISVTAIILLLHTLNSFLFFTSMARPLGASQGASDARRVTPGLAASISTISLEFFDVDVKFARAIHRADSRASSPIGKVAMISLFLALMAVASLERPFIVKMRLRLRLVADGVGVLSAHGGLARSSPASSDRRS